MSVVLGLTGSIGMGKSTTAGFFRDLGIPVWDADAAVHRLYQPGGSAAKAMAIAFPGAIAESGAVDRALLRAIIASDPSALDRINAIVHPLVAADRMDFIVGNVDKPLIVLDIPLLFETGGHALCDAIVVVSTPADVQRARVLARGMSPADFELILSRQMPDAEKRARADHVIETLTLDQARAEVEKIVQQYIGKNQDA